MNAETSAAKAWLGRLSLRHEDVGATFRHLASNLSTRDLAEAMRGYLIGAIEHAERNGLEHMLSAHGRDALSRIDFDRIARDFQDIVERYARRHDSGGIQPFRRFR